MRQHATHAVDAAQGGVSGWHATQRAGTHLPAKHIDVQQALEVGVGGIFELLRDCSRHTTSGHEVDSLRRLAAAAHQKCPRSTGERQFGLRMIRRAADTQGCECHLHGGLGRTHTFFLDDLSKRGGDAFIVGNVAGLDDDSGTRCGRFNLRLRACTSRTALDALHSSGHSAGSRHALSSTGLRRAMITTVAPWRAAACKSPTTPATEGDEQACDSTPTHAEAVP